MGSKGSGRAGPKGHCVCLLWDLDEIAAVGLKLGDLVVCSFISGVVCLEMVRCKAIEDCVASLCVID